MDKNKENYLKFVLGLLSMMFLIYIGTTLFKRARVDFTEEKLYTLSEGTIKILSKLDSPIKIKLYYSKTAANKGTEGLRVLNNYYQYVRDFLKEYESHSRNNITLNFIDPRPDTEEEEDAIAYGLKKFSLTDTESYFFGLVAENETGVEKIIEFFDPSRKDRLEYELTKIVYTVLNPRKKNIGILSSLDVVNEEVSPYMAQIMQMQGRPVKSSWSVVKMLEEFYNVQKIEKETKEIKGIDTLVIIHPTGFTEKTLLAVDQFLMRGGKMLVFVDPQAISAGRGGPMGGGAKSPDKAFAKLMDKWGVELVPNSYAGDKYLSGMGQTSAGGPAARILPLMVCNDKCSADYNDSITSGLNNVTLIFPGVLKSKKTEGLSHKVIMATTSKGNSYTAHQYELNNPTLLWNKFEEGKKPVPLAYKITGIFETAFPNGIKKDPKDKKTDKNPVKIINKSKQETAVVVFSNVDALSDQFAFRDTFIGTVAVNDNSSLFLNAVEALTGDMDLLSVRSKARIDRSFEVIKKIEIAAEKQTKSKVNEINSNISRYEKELEELGKSATEGNLAILQNVSLKKKKELLKKIVVLKKELRAVKREGREKVEKIGRFFLYLNTLFVPILVILFGLFYSRKRKKILSGSLKKNVRNNLEELEEVRV